MTPARFREIGELLYGPSWRGIMADALNVADRTLRRWENNDRPLPENIGDELAVLCFAQATKLIKEGKRLGVRK